VYTGNVQVTDERRSVRSERVERREASGGGTAPSAEAY
jgi:hypothetical protein